MRSQTARIKVENEDAIREYNSLVNTIGKDCNNYIKAVCFDELVAGFTKLFKSGQIRMPSDSLLDSIDNPTLTDFFEGNLTGVMSGAAQIMVAAIDGATTVTPSYGGGGGSNDLPKKKDDEDWWKYAGRAVSHSRAKRKASVRKSSGYRP